MRKLVVHATPVAAPDVAFTDPDGAETAGRLDGRVRLVNFWATWCAPCREEMPALDALARARGGADFAVIADRHRPQQPRRHRRASRRRHDITALPTLLDPKGALAAAMNVPGLPVTVLLDRDGAEVARMLGGADWNGPEAHAVIDALIAAE